MGIATAFGATTSILNAQAAAEAQEQQAQAQASSLEQQAEQEAQNQIQRSLTARRENIRRLAAAEAGYAASGVTLQGTPTLALGTMAEENELEVQMMESSSRAKQGQLLTDAHNVLSMAGYTASSTRTGGWLEGIGTGLNGMAGMARMGYRANRDGRI